MPFCRECGREVEHDWQSCPFCTQLVGPPSKSNVLEDKREIEYWLNAPPPPDFTEGMTPEWIAAKRRKALGGLGVCIIGMSIIILLIIADGVHLYGDDYYMLWILFSMLLSTSLVLGTLRLLPKNGTADDVWKRLMKFGEICVKIPGMKKYALAKSRKITGGNVHSIPGAAGSQVAPPRPNSLLTQYSDSQPSAPPPQYSTRIQTFAPSVSESAPPSPNLGPAPTPRTDLYIPPSIAPPIAPTPPPILPGPAQLNAAIDILGQAANSEQTGTHPDRLNDALASLGGNDSNTDDGGKRPPSLPDLPSKLIDDESSEGGFSQ